MTSTAAEHDAAPQQVAFEQLPDECIHLVFSHLSTQMRLQARLVCRQLRAALSSPSLLWQSVKLDWQRKQGSMTPHKTHLQHWVANTIAPVVQELEIDAGTCMCGVEEDAPRDTRQRGYAYCHALARAATHHGARFEQLASLRVFVADFASRVANVEPRVLRAIAGAAPNLRDLSIGVQLTTSDGSPSAAFVVQTERALEGLKELRSLALIAEPLDAWDDERDPPCLHLPPHLAMTLTRLVMRGWYPCNRCSAPVLRGLLEWESYDTAATLDLAPLSALVNLRALAVASGHSRAAFGRPGSSYDMVTLDETDMLFPHRLSHITGLTQLALAFDVDTHVMGSEAAELAAESFSFLAPLTRLRRLAIVGAGLWQVPDAVFSLPLLQHLNLQRNVIAVLPARLTQLTALSAIDLRGRDPCWDDYGVDDDVLSVACELGRAPALREILLSHGYGYGDAFFKDSMRCRVDFVGEPRVWIDGADAEWCDEDMDLSLAVAPFDSGGPSDADVDALRAFDWDAARALMRKVRFRLDDTEAADENWERFRRCRMLE